MFFGAKAELYTLALQMRKNPTEAERAMWKILRKFRKSGFPFRRQHPIEFYIADFYCHKLRLVIEVDGEIESLRSKTSASSVESQRGIFDPQ